MSESERAEWAKMLEEVEPKLRAKFKRTVRRMNQDPVEVLWALGVLFLRLPREMQERVLLLSDE